MYIGLSDAIKGWGLTIIETISLTENNFRPPLGSFKLMMVQNSIWQTSMLLKASFINVLELNPINKMVSLNENINTFIMLLDPYSSSFHLPSKFWGDCILTAVYLINRIPTPNLQSRSPFELLFSIKPSYKHLCVFGCLCSVFTLTHNRSKFRLRARPCVFLRNSYNTKVYKLDDLNSHTTFISRDVIFHEKLFPFQPSPSST